jgi:hypothetical protein
MCHCQNHDLVFAHLIDNPIREPIEAMLPHAFSYWLPGVRELSYSPRSCVELIEKFRGQTLACGFVPRGSFIDLDLCRGLDAPFHDLRG